MARQSLNPKLGSIRLINNAIVLPCEHAAIVPLESESMILSTQENMRSLVPFMALLPAMSVFIAAQIEATNTRPSWREFISSYPCSIGGAQARRSSRAIAPSRRVAAACQVTGPLIKILGIQFRCRRASLLPVSSPSKSVEELENLNFPTSSSAFAFTTA